MSPAAPIPAIIELLCRSIARHGLARLLAGPLIVLIWGRARGIGAQIEALLARMQQGRLRRYPARRPPRPAIAARRPPARSGLPRTSAWLVALIPETAGSAAQLRVLLSGPEIPALLQAAPQLRRTLRPLCWMLGVRLPLGVDRPAADKPPPLEGAGREADRGWGRGASAPNAVRPNPSPHPAPSRGGGAFAPQFAAIRPATAIAPPGIGPPPLPA